jgi:hypothetical protein
MMVVEDRESQTPDSEDDVKPMQNTVKFEQMLTDANTDT